MSEGGREGGTGMERGGEVGWKEKVSEGEGGREKCATRSFFPLVSSQ